LAGKPVAGLAPGPRRLRTRGRALHGSGKFIGSKQPTGTQLRQFRRTSTNPQTAPQLDAERSSLTHSWPVNLVFGMKYVGHAPLGIAARKPRACAKSQRVNRLLFGSRRLLARNLRKLVRRKLLDLRRFPRSNFGFPAAPRGGWRVM